MKPTRTKLLDRIQLIVKIVNKSSYIKIRICNLGTDKCTHSTYKHSIIFLDIVNIIPPHVHGVRRLLRAPNVYLGSSEF